MLKILKLYNMLKKFAKNFMTKLIQQTRFYFPVHGIEKQEIQITFVNVENTQYEI